MCGNFPRLVQFYAFSLIVFRDMVCSVAGITSDANVLTNELRMIAQRYLLQYGESIPCEQLVSWLCDVKQAYTQYGGKLERCNNLLLLLFDRLLPSQVYLV